MTTARGVCPAGAAAVDGLNRYAGKSSSATLQAIGWDDCVREGELANDSHGARLFRREIAVDRFTAIVFSAVRNRRSSYLSFQSSFFSFPPLTSGGSPGNALPAPV